MTQRTKQKGHDMIDWLTLHTFEVWIFLSTVVLPITLVIRHERRRSHAHTLASSNANEVSK